MKYSVVTFATLSVVLAGVSFAQSASDRTAAEQQVVARALDFWRNVFTPLNFDQFKNYIPERYTEHYPGLSGERQAMIDFLKPIKERSPQGLPPGDPLITVVDGDITLMLVPGMGGPPSGGKQALGMEVQRWKSGLQVEHWDHDATAAPVTKPALEGRSAAEKRNLELVVKFWHEVLEPLKTQELSKYVAEDYIEHDAMRPRGALQGLRGYLDGLRRDNPNGLARTPFTMTLVDGDLVALVYVKEPRASAQDAAKKPTLGVDLSRVKSGKIVEHWGDVLYVN